MSWDMVSTKSWNRTPSSPPDRSRRENSADLSGAPHEDSACEIGTPLGVRTNPMPVGSERMGKTGQAPSAVQEVLTRQEVHGGFGGLSQGHHERVELRRAPRSSGAGPG